MPRSAAVFGGTGLVGRHCLDVLSADPAYDRIVCIGRRPPAASHEKIARIMRSLDEIPELGRADVGAIEDVFCCLGTTQAKAGTAEAFRSVDRDAVVASCAFAVRTGARHFLMVSAVGASSRSPILYNRTKGEAEEGCSAYADQLRVSIFRPSLLIGERDEFRYKEKLGEPFLRLLSPVMLGPFSKYKPVGAETVAVAMVGAAKTDRAATGCVTYEHDEIVRLARAR